MSDYQTLPESGKWMCSRCGVPLEPGPVDISYLGSAFPVNLLRCPSCGLVLVPEELALGKMAEVERTLEDK
jgi:hypothetical protein